MKPQWPFRKINYVLMLLGVLGIALGFTLMALDPTPHRCGLLGLTVGPITVCLGLAIQFLAIFL
ncbi:MAG: DUF3098 domain-containing protein [Bacteroidota bacterium]